MSAQPVESCREKQGEPRTRPQHITSFIVLHNLAWVDRVLVAHYDLACATAVGSVNMNATLVATERTDAVKEAETGGTMWNP